jgi:hypothetical protein
MNREVIKSIDLTKVLTLEQSKELNVVLINLLEQLFTEYDKQSLAVQELRDEINRIKGEKGKPIFKPNKESEQKTQKGKPRNKNNKKGRNKSKIIIDKEIVCGVDKSILPSDAQFKGYEEHIQQDLEIKRSNTLYKIELYYSKKEKKVYRGVVPQNGLGMYGSGVKTWLHLLNRCCDTTQGRLKVLFESLGIGISTGSINNYLLEPQDWVLEEQKAILKAGISSGSYCQIDGTKSVERGMSKVTQIICGAFFTTFYTKSNKKRISILEALMGMVEGKSALKYGYNEHTKKVLEALGVSPSDRARLEKVFWNKDKHGIFEWLGDKEAFEQYMSDKAPDIMSKKNIYVRVKESFALGYYYSQDEFPVVDFLLSDDAPEYRKLSLVLQGLCWIHDARYYKKLIPKLECHRAMLSNVMEDYWDFYEMLLTYKKETKEKQEATKEAIKQEFDRIFTQKTEYFQLNSCLERTLNNKDKLLAVLENPALPLHNNSAELEARRIVRKRDISLHTWSFKGTIVRDAFMSVIQTCIKLEVSPFNYIMDRIKGDNLMPSLSTLILHKSF